LWQNYANEVTVTGKQEFVRSIEVLPKPKSIKPMLSGEHSNFSQIIERYIV